MSYLLDTDTCIYWLNGLQPILDHIKSTGLSDIAISAITAAELYFGAFNSAKVNENVARIEIFLSHLTLLSLDDAVLRKFGRTKAELRRRGEPLADFDLLIASTAQSAGRILVTNNTRHYVRIGNLQLENWLDMS